MYLLVELTMNWNTSVYSLMALIFCGVKIIDSANILVVIPVPAHSHLKSFQPLWEELVKRGHNLTLIAGHKLSNEFQYNYTFMDLKPYFGELSKLNIDTISKSLGLWFFKF